ncbi:MAG TPA: glycosyltransferase family 4 protein, partial [Thermodesulfobacteriota bacterium]|nr:glycosyltransferase family 4 protein [Thermodesulfobacteriota bacterium]
SFRTLLQTANPWAYAGLRKVIREFKPDIVHAKIILTQLSPLILPLLRDVPSLYHVAWYRPICPTGTRMLPDGSACTVRAGTPCYVNGCLPLRDWAPLMIQMKLFRRWRDAFGAVLANSESVRDVLSQNGIDGVEVLHYGIQISEDGIPLFDTPTVAYAGRLVREKGVDILIRAFASITAELPDARLIIAGDGPERGNLEALISGLALSAKVIIHGHLSRRALDDNIGPAWVQVVPSLWAEPFGITAVEAMLRGTAVVASASGGLREIVEDCKSGYLVPPGDADALSEKLLLLLGDKSLCQSIGRAGRARAESMFSEEAFMKKLLCIYDSLRLRHGERQVRNTVP